MIAIEETDRRILVDTYNQIDSLENSITALQSQLDGCKVPIFARQLREEIRKREFRLRSLNRQASAILTMLP